MDHLLESLRGTSINKTENEIDFTKKFLAIERETHQQNKQYLQDLFELRQSQKDSDMHIKSLRH